MMATGERGRMLDEVTRDELHHRRIDMRGYRRSDGLFEVEGRVIDRKTEDFSPASGDRLVPAGQAIHDMGVRLVFDARMEVIAVHTFTDASPYADCPGGGASLQALVGLRMSNGWSREVNSRLARAGTCTHLRELLIPLASAAFQSLSAYRNGSPDRVDASGRPVKIDSCYAYAAERELVRQRWPEFHRPSGSG